MTINSKGIALIKSFESCKLKAYRCPAGVWTIGYGHTKGVKEGMVISQEDAEKFFDEDIKDFEKQLNSLQLAINQNQYDALMSFIYNVGVARLAKSTLLKKVKANPGDASIRQEFNKWVYSGAHKLPGLQRRRAAEADLYFS
ncbi:MAG: lysozyme [Bacteroidales bacterium]|nr:lysozyme [Candidatus Scybalousia scybalohippi]